MATFPSLSAFVADYTRQSPASRPSPERRTAPETTTPAPRELATAQQVQRTRDRSTLEERPPASEPAEYQYDSAGEVARTASTQAAPGQRLNITV